MHVSLSGIEELKKSLCQYFRQSSQIRTSLDRVVRHCHDLIKSPDEIYIETR